MRAYSVLLGYSTYTVATYRDRVMRWKLRDERPIRLVPTGTVVALACAITAQLWVGMLAPPPLRSAEPLGKPLDVGFLRLAFLDERPVAARTMMIHLQNFDLSATNGIPYRALDYRQLSQWLQVALELDPKSKYPLFLATHVYMEVSDISKIRVMLDFVHAKFLEDPPARWQWLAHATLIAKHRLRDLTLARAYAAELTRLSRSVPGMPMWAKEMESFMLEEMGELEAARIMLGGLLDGGHITDPDEIRFLHLRIQQLGLALRSEKSR